jgi:hypothetical protein
MTTPLLRDYGSTITVTGANAIASNAYSNSADVMHINGSALGSTNYLLADFRVTGSFSTAPVAGSLQLIKVPRDFSGNIGPTPASTLLGTQIFTFGPLPQASNTVKTSIIFSVDAVPLDYDADYWLFNNSLGQSLATSYTFVALPWSPGT